ncbi:putative PXMP2/4 family protein 4 [Nannochloris sp. 'desiccata']|nr:putative PXMP2/4 family protein 4 [Chlorella desiccata (nom. nud.)]
MARVPPLLKAALTSSSVMCAGDAMFQAIRCKTANQDIQIDLKESLRMALIGFTLHGPLVYSSFRWVDKSVGAQSRSFLTAAKVAAISQVTFFPVYSTAFFTYVGLLEGLSLQQCKEKVIAAVPPTILTGTAFWPAVTVINFMYVPPAGRVLYVNAAGLFWNAWLSYENAVENAAHLETEKNGNTSSSKKE